MGKHSKANKLCECGSGRKYKKCCLLYESDLEKINQLIYSLTEIDLTKQYIEKVLEEIENKILQLNLSENVLSNIYINLVQHYQKLGRDSLVLELIEKYKFDESDHLLTRMNFKTYKLIAFRNLYEFEKVVKLIPEILEMVNTVKWGSSTNNALKSGVMVELGKTLGILANIHEDDNQYEIDLCLELYDEIIEVYETHVIDDIDHYHAALTNKASIQLKYAESENIKSVDKIKGILREKLNVGNLLGVANAYSILAVHFFKEKDYKQAIAYTKKDIALSEEYGSYLDLITPLLNLSILYSECKQFSNAKQVARKALQFAEKVNNRQLVEKINKHIKRIDDDARLCNLNGELIGKKAICPCKSNKLYVECCGEADYDYIELNNVLASPELFHFTDLVRNEGNTKLNFDSLKTYLRPLKENEIRVSWLNIVSKGAYQEIYELADMASLNLVSAKQLLRDFVNRNKIDLNETLEEKIIQETSVALSICILSVNSLEAFVNQLIYFLTQINETEMAKHIKENMPEGLLTNFTDYQRNKRFEDKLNIIFNLYTNNRWNKFEKFTNKELSKLISIRNELVHFKSQKYTKIIPSNKEEPILKNLPKEIELREINNSWPLKLLNISFANWCINLSESIINFVKESYINEEENNKIGTIKIV
jgi:uncharacterized protein YchJ